MSLNLYYYIRILIREGHEAQYQNMNGTAKTPAAWFTLPQIIFLVLSTIYVLFRKEGLSSNVIDYILSALSIMSALFMGLIVIVLDKLKAMKFKSEFGKSDENHLHVWNFIKQFASITSYATLLSLLLICMLIGSLLVGMPMNVEEYEFVAPSEIQIQNVILFIKLSCVISVRFLFCYFLLDFLLMTFYAIALIFQSINTDLQIVKPEVKININKEESIMDSISYEFGKYSYWKGLGVVVIFILLGILYVIF